VKRNAAVILSLTAMLSCSTYNQPTKSVGPDALAEWSVPYTNTETLRKPSSEVTSKPTYHWEADTLKIPLSAGTPIDQKFNVKYTQYAVYDMVEPVLTDTSHFETRWTHTATPVLVCDEKAGTGKSEAWNAFYSAPGAQKAAALAKAIDGVGNSTAIKLVKGNYFNSKPKSWHDFEVVIERAAADRVIEESAEYDVLYKFRQANMEKLGYQTQVSGACQMVIVDHKEPTQVWITSSAYVNKTVTHRDVISSETKAYELKVSGQLLQAWEHDMLVFSFNHDTNQISLAQAAYNNYGIAFDGRVITVKALSRKLVNLPTNVFPAGATLESSNGSASFTAGLNPAYLPSTTADGYMMVSVQVHSCKKGLFAGSCAVFGRDEKIEQKAVKQVSRQASLAKHVFPISPGRIYWVNYWVNMQNSPWYTNNVVQGTNTPQL
jgi:hypothetical protein